MMKAISQEAKVLASAHRKADPDTTLIKFFPSARSNEICLLEISKSAPTTGEVLPFTFREDVSHGVDYPSTVILLSPQEWLELKGGKLALPEGWDLDTAEDL
ncbi:MAG: hypothetical protein WCN95_02645 [bacterium]